ncbi:SDR family oxidoreductase [Rhodococcus sp. D-46]|uniref:SDR family oxidoreductase n=1 Tax=Rhodococcus sp. D-46 TaxID=2716265 RepID=UPI0013F5F289|nr:SDR family oxidoreductase [Rhodococcus sp. D-46]
MSAPVAIVTGAAAGLGAAIAERLAEDFGTLLLLDIEEAALADTAARLESLGVAVHTARCDVRREGDVKNAFDVAASAGSPTALVNGAGIGVFTPFLEITEDQWDNTFAVNTKGSFLMCREFVSRTEGPASIVNIASIGARLGGDMLAHYGPSKAAVIEMSHSVARIGATRGLRSNTVMPGLILTDMWLRTIKELRRRDPSLTDVSDADVFDSFVAQMVPMGRAQTPGDIAEMVAFLLSDKARNVTGQTIAVDGGAVMT